MLHSASLGWPPARYRELGTGFVVRQMTAVHQREAVYDEALLARTWVSESRRDMLMRRETEITGVLRTTAEWVHVGATSGPTRASPLFLSCFPVTADAAPAVALPGWAPIDPVALPPLVVRPWWTEMDPMGHVNHPRYLDWAEEAVSAWLARAGIDPIGLVPIAEHVRYRSAATAGDTVEVRGHHVGNTADAAVFRLFMTRGGARLCDATLVRAHTAGPAVFRSAA